MSETSANTRRFASCVIVCSFTTYDSTTDEDMFGDLLRHEPMGLNPCSDSINDLLMVWEPTQLVPRASQCSATVQPRTHALSGKKKRWTRCSEMRNLFQEDPQRPGHALKIEIKNKSGKIVRKIRW